MFSIRLRPVILASVVCAPLLASGSQPAMSSGSTASPTLAAMQQAAAHWTVPLGLIEAIGYTSTHWRMELANDGTVGPMHLRESPGGASLSDAAALSGRSAAELRTSVPANFDAGAAWLSAHSTGASTASLPSWRPAVAALLGERSAGAVYRLLATGITAPAPTGEAIAIAPNPGLASAAPGPGPRDTSAPSDYPGVSWVPADPNNYEAHVRPANPVIDLVIVHVAQGSYDGTVATFQNPAANASAQYVMRSSDGAATQMVREKDIAWSAGNLDYSSRSISLEHEGFVDDSSWFTDAMYQASARIVAAAVRKYDIPIDRRHIIGHNEVPDPNNPGQFGGRDHHTDPGPYWNWSKYMALVSQYAACPPARTGVVAAPAAAAEETAAVGTDCGLWVHRAGSPGFNPLGGTMIGAPAVTTAVSGLGPLYIGNFSNHNLYVRGGTQDWVPLTGGGGTAYCLDNPAAVVTGSSLTVACEGRDRGLWTASVALSPGVLPQVSGWTSAGGTLAAGPAVGVVGGGLLFAVIGTDSHVWTRGSAGFSQMSYRCYGHPALASSSSVAYFACHGVDGAVWYATNTGSTWSKARSLAGLVVNGVGIAVTGTGTTFYAEGLDRHAWHRGLTAGWTTDGGNIAYGAAAADS
ncbi:MAG TPA: N-acetylmuramoyl-L-alanine amidase [Candidatus Dormibacteraeota bacterium]|nr:N-acetylmuramoyl-L-alanine amidase [Candidatus Dormibacteraeota bacterium]